MNVRYLKYLFLLIVIASCTTKKQILKKALPGKTAEMLTKEVVAKTNATCWDSVSVIAWGFGKRKHRWDRLNGKCIVVKGKNEIHLNLHDLSQGKSYKNGKEELGKKKEKSINRAYHWWANDSYWLNPFAKFFDEGVERLSYKDLKGQNHLVISYKGRNNKIGDTYDWTLDKDGVPVKWNLFVKVIPISNYGFSWEKWKFFPCGVQFSQLHKSIFLKVKLENITIESFP